MQGARQSVWENYVQSRSANARRDLVVSYLPLVKYVVTRMGVPAGHASTVVKENDLVQFGVIGLLEAIDRFNPGRGVKFETFAVPRIKGTIQDELRKLDWVPRSVRKKVRLAERFRQEVEMSEADTDIEDLLAAKLAISPGEIRRLMEALDPDPVEMRSYSDGSESAVENLPSGDTDQLEVIGSEEMKGILRQYVEQLPERDRIVITLYYFENLTFKEIAAVVGVSDSRVFQIHAKVLKDLRLKLQGMF